MPHLLPGSPYPLGATWDGTGVNFALYSENGAAVDLCLFDEAGEETRLRLTQRTAYVWHGYVPDLRPGQRYGYRVHGAYEPQKGLRFNPNVLLLDPYARAVDGVERWEAGCFAYQLGHPEQDLVASDQPALGAPRGVVIDPAFDWEDDAAPRTPLARSVIYEAHVRGLTKLHPDIPENLRGSYASMAHPAIIRHLRELGITALELMPIHAFIDDKVLLDRGLRNYWGYNSIGFFAPDVRYRCGAELGAEVREFKTMVKALHRAGIEVILDVVYNHTAEGNHLGPSFSFKGIDNPTYYRLSPEDPRYYFDYTGTGNTLNVRHPQVLTMIMDSLRYWAEEMHVDGFRFDLASTLARQLHEVDRLSSFFTLIHDSPSLREVKLIAEPWDVGEGGYQVGNFPVRWAEWNGRYRDSIRALWKGEGGRAAELGYRLTGSSDLYASNGRAPAASVNFVTAHDGFTLRDLVSYDHKHNEANGEDNRDGNDHEHSWNCGAEGPTEDAGINELRRRQQRNLMATLVFSQGTPMLVAGDEVGRTQGGNNNAYCQDNPVSWFDWNWNAEQRSLFEFTKRALRLRRRHPALRRSKFFQGRPIHGTDLSDLAWFRNDGQPMSEEDWSNPGTRSMAMFLAGRGIDDVDETGRPLVDDNLLLLVNAHHEDVTFTMPLLDAAKEPWQLVVYTADDRALLRVSPGEQLTLPGRSLALFRSPSRAIRMGGAMHTLGATYRLQLHAGFGFKQALAQVDYLRELGITDVYSSPIFTASRGSTHGYDVVDHSRLNPELGTDEDFAAWTDALRKSSMGLVVDWVPNHMGITAGQNPWWENVLENGPSSLFADYFDIDWRPPKPEMRDTILLPVLGDQYGISLEKGELQVAMDRGAFVIAYFEHRFPLGPRTVLPLIEESAARTGLAEDDEAQEELESIRAAVEHLPNRHQTEPLMRKERAREKEVIKRRLHALVERSEPVARAFASTLQEFNGTPGMSASFDKLDRLLRDQSYRLASWRVASEEINYRRFFDVNSLAALKMEEPAVFERAHAQLFRLLHEGRVRALRLDHTDGLYDPLGYFETLQRRFTPSATTPRTNPDDAARPLPILIEKILEPGERLPPTWPVDGTTGYEFAGLCTGVMVDSTAEEAMTSIYRRFTGDGRSFADHVYECKRQILHDALASEVNMLARQLERIAGASRRWRDFTLVGLTRALTEVLAAFPVYRTYLRPGDPPTDEDIRRVRQAIQQARRREAALDTSLFRFLEDVLLLRAEGNEEERRAYTQVALRFQQLTGPATAKSVEDTAFYRYHRLIALNEVGNDPGVFGNSIEAFHAANLERLRSWPLGMICTSTHDTKRGEDARARIATLSEIPGEWQRTVTRWSRTLARHRGGSSIGPIPSRHTEYMLYQALLGAWPFGWDGRDEATRNQLLERLLAFTQKAGREAKLETTWVNPSGEYEKSVERFLERALGDEGFMSDVASFSARLEPHAITNALSQTLMRLCSPGVPDTYQGSELWNQSFVDPDNRRMVDFDARRGLLAEVPRTRPAELLQRAAQGDIKLLVTAAALRLRRTWPDMFLRGDYDAIPAGEHVIAFLRSRADQKVVMVVPRLTCKLMAGNGGLPDSVRWPIGQAWGAHFTAVPAGDYRNLLTGERLQSTGELATRDLLAQLPVALLVNGDDF
jgi:isoamylase